MSLIEPKIDDLLDIMENDRFLLCTIAAKRARDINDMMRGQGAVPLGSSCARSR